MKKEIKTHVWKKYTDVKLEQKTYNVRRKQGEQYKIINSTCIFDFDWLP